MTKQFINDLVNSWILAWNTHDLEAVLSHYTEDFEIVTPMAVKVLSGSNGIVRGKDNIRNYWRKGLDLIPHLHFEILDVLTGIDSIAIYYVNTATNRRSVENLFLNDDGKINRAVVMYDISQNNQ